MSYGMFRRIQVAWRKRRLGSEQITPVSIPTSRLEVVEAAQMSGGYPEDAELCSMRCAKRG